MRIYKRASGLGYVAPRGFWLLFSLGCLSTAGLTLVPTTLTHWSWLLFAALDVSQLACHVFGCTWLETLLVFWCLPPLHGLLWYSPLALTPCRPDATTTPVLLAAPWRAQDCAPGPRLAAASCFRKRDQRPHRSSRWLGCTRGSVYAPPGDSGHSPQRHAAGTGTPEPHHHPHAPRPPPASVSVPQAAPPASCAALSCSRTAPLLPVMVLM